MYTFGRMPRLSGTGVCKEIGSEQFMIVNTGLCSGLTAIDRGHDRSACLHHSSFTSVYLPNISGLTYRT
jgi:hypothetical protein